MVYLNVDISLRDDRGNNLRLSESVEVETMNFGQISRLLEGYHIVTEAVKEARNLNVNGQEVRYNV